MKLGATARNALNYHSIICRCQVPVPMLWRRATAIGERPGSRPSMTMSRFCVPIQLRRRSLRIITSTGFSHAHSHK